MLSAEVDGWPLLSRLARSLQTAMLLAAAPAPWRISAAAELLDDLERRDDRWTVCVTSLAIGAVYALDRPARSRHADAAAGRGGRRRARRAGAAGVGRSCCAAAWRYARANPRRAAGGNAVRAATGLGLLTNG